MERRVFIARAVYTAVFTALVFVATAMIAIETPATKGFFNFGETMVYTTALLTMDPIVAAFAGGVGSMLADVYLGYGHYAPGTLVIKGIEGLLAVTLINFFIKFRKYWSQLLAIMAILLGATIVVIGTVLYSGETILYLGNNEIIINIDPIYWVILGIIVTVIVLVIGFKYEELVGIKIIGLMIAGLEMVFGYFLYQVFILGYQPPVAATELPVNIGQALIGITIGLPLSETLRKMGVGIGFGSEKQ
ncbi:ECF transporter S component [Desulfurococcaceae archaeon MEX13E-LK6-19]|nr:ECF transporter S component [Desulfurococcaceae archaeon MEX13E-LK6-19]